MVDLLSSEDAGRVADVLWQYRRQLDRMEFLLETQLLLAAAGKDEHLHHVADLLNETADALAYIDLQRGVLLSDRGIPVDLSELIKVVDSPWDEVFSDHKQWFASSLARIQDLSARNRRTIEQSQAALGELADLLSGETSDNGYDGAGRKVSSSGGSALLFDGQV